MWCVTGETVEKRSATADRITHGFERLDGKIPGLLKFEIGVDSSRVDYACEVVLYSEYTSMAALQGYDYLVDRIDKRGHRPDRSGFPIKHNRCRRSRPGLTGKGCMPFRVR